ncbi:hypothetical protein D3C72_1765410 [compost metagenome]
MKREAKNRPPRKFEPMEMALAAAFSRNSPASPYIVSSASILRCSAPWPLDSTCGEISASPPTATPPIAGRSQPGMALLRAVSSMKDTACISVMPMAAHTTPRKMAGT